GWEGVGLASYLLIGFWYKELANAGSGMKAFIVNRFGDAFFVIGLFGLFWGLQGTWADPTAKAGDRLAPASVASQILPDYFYDEGAKEQEDAIGPRIGEATKGADVGAAVAAHETPAATLTFHTLRGILTDEKRLEELRDRTIFGMP